METAVSSTVFVVDDDPEVGKSLKWLLESAGLSVRIFQSAHEFLRIITPRDAGCLILDVRMPELNGLDLLERLKELGTTLPVIMLTAYANVSSAVRAMKTGAVHVFEKPVGDQELLEQVHAAIASDRQRRLQQQAVVVARQHYSQLTQREQQVLEMVATGMSSKEIGQTLGVSFKTVEAHRAKIMRKMQVDSIPQLIRQHLLVTATNS